MWRSIGQRLAAGCLAGLVAVPWSFADEAPKPPVPLIKLEYPGNPPNIRMLYVRLLALGDHQVDVPLLFDTGSVGITVECESVLPARYCSASGIKIDAPLELEGLTVTTRPALAQYGTYDEYGNIAYATVSFGAREHPISTAERIPILVRYKKVRRATGEIVGGPLWPKGVFGVSPVGSMAGLRSPMSAIEVPAGQHKGYRLSPVGAEWNRCTNEEGTCPEVAALHIGIDPAIEKDFTLAKLKKLPSEHYFPFVETCITWQQEKVCRPAIYDTGNSTIVIAGKPPKGTVAPLPIGTAVAASVLDAAAWRFSVQYEPEVEFAPQMDIHLIGIRYFETNSLLVDLDGQEVGFRLGQ
ncbi:MAG TPA: hypothetical protein VGF43_23120 [Dongiaceae bacterium]|jgi:hypothetical protein